MARVALDANVIVGYLDDTDSLYARATALFARLEAGEHETVLFDVLAAEAISVMCRRARQRKTKPPDLASALLRVRRWQVEGKIEPISQEISRYFDDVLDAIEETGGVLNFNDGLLVVLQREGIIGDVASFDEGFDVVPDFRRLS
jgi:predicted nucleic acid-binding protein